MTMFFGVLLARQIGLDVGGDAAVLPLLATQMLWINLVVVYVPFLQNAFGTTSLHVSDWISVLRLQALCCG